MKTTKHHISLILSCLLFCSVFPVYGQLSCSPGYSLLQLYTGYGKTYSVNSTTYVTNGAHAMGIPDGAYSTVKQNATPANRGILTLDLSDNIPINDTIYFVASSASNALCTWDVSTSSDGTNFSTATSFSTSTSTLGTFTYVVNNASGARYIRFSNTNSSKDLRVDGVYYNKKTCAAYCLSSAISYGSGTAYANPTTPNASTCSNPDRALGDPDHSSFAKLNNSSVVLYLDLGTVVPYGTYVQLFLAADGAGATASFSVSGSKNDTTFTNTQNFTTTVTQPDFTDFYYNVTQTTGIRYLKIMTTTAVIGDVDAVTYKYPAYWGYNYISGYVFSDPNRNNVKDGGETGAANITVNLIKDYNTNGQYDAGDAIIQTAATSSGGSYQFACSSLDTNYLVNVLSSTLPVGNSLTGTNLQSATFTTMNNSDCGNNFGYYICSGNCTPIAEDDYSVATVGTATYLNVLFNDYDPNGNLNIGTLAVITQPKKGSVIVNSGVLVYTPIGTGYDTLYYKIGDSTSLYDTAKVVINISAFVSDPCVDAGLSHLFYLPAPEQDLRTAFSRADCHSGGSLSDSMRTIISMKCPYAGTVITYDQWEDGYETNIMNPTQSTTVVWGDGDPYNGIAPGYSTDIIPSSGNIVLDNTMFDNPRNTSQTYYDAKDKIYSNTDIALSRIAWDKTRGVLQAYSVDVYDLTRFGTSFSVPVGNYTGCTKDFQYTGAFIRAAYNNTVVSIDKDNNGVVDTTVTLSEGGSYFQNSGVLAGASITSSLPVGVDIVFGDSASCYNLKELNILPAQYYGDTYYSPVPTTKSPDSAVAMFYNPLNQSIQINWTTSASSGNFTISGKGVYRFPLGTNGYKFKSAGGESFVVNQLIDAWTMDGTTSNAADYDWAFALIPESRLTSFASIAWAPGSSDGSANGNPVWAMPTAATTLYVKFDGNINGTSGNTSPCGLKYDSSYALSALQVKKLMDNSDKDQSGLAAFTCDGTKISMAYGEDPSLCSIATPYIDVGTSIQPFCMSKQVFANDDYEFTLTDQPVTIQALRNDTGFTALLDRTSVSTTGFLQPSHGIVSVNSDGTLLYTPNSGYTGMDTLVYQVCSTPSVVCDEAYVIININSCPSPANKNLISGTVFYDASKDGTKNNSESGYTPAKVYLYTDANCNSAIDANELTDSALVDASGTFQFVYYPEKTIADNFNDANGNRTCANGSDGTASWSSDWVDAGDNSVGFCQNGSIGNIDADIIKDALGVGLRLKDNNVSVSRSANLSGATAAYLSFSYRRKSTTFTTGEADSVQVSANGTIFTTIYTVTGNASVDPAYIDVTNLNILPYATSSFAIRIKTNNSVDEADSVYFDNISIKYLKYNQCYIVQLDTLSSVPAYYYVTTAKSQTFTATSAGTCFSPYNFGIAKNTISISGTLYNDVNGMSDNLVNGTAFDSPSGTTLYAYLVNSSNKVVSKDTFNNGNGTYSFPNADVLTSYTVLISKLNVDVGANAPAVSLPKKWTSTGENYGSNNSAGSGNEAGTPNSSIAVTSGSSNVTGVNFGIQMPDAGPDKAACLAYGNNSVTMAAVSATGTWTAKDDNPGTATITSPTSKTTTITNFSDLGTYNFIWSNNDASDTASVVITGPDAGIDFSTCSGSTATLNGNYTSGAWTAKSGNPSGASLGSTTNGVASVTFSNPVSGTYYFIYTVSTCPDTIALTVPANPSAGTINYSMTDCADADGYIAQLTASNPSPNTGLWTKVSGPGTILSPATNLASITGVTAGQTAIVKWVVTTSLGCKDSISQNMTAPSIDTSMVSKYSTYYCLTCPVRDGNTFTYYDANGKILMKVTDISDANALDNTSVCANLNYNPSGNNNPVSANVQTIASTDQQPYLPRSWSVNPTNTNAQYQARLFFTDEELNALAGRAAGTQWAFNDVNTLAVTGYPNVNTNYTVPGGPNGSYYQPVFERVGNYWMVTVTATGANTFFIHPKTYPWATLPVELVSLRAVPMETYISVEWITASELNNDHFDVERSTDGISFIKTGEVKGSGNTKEIKRYSFKDITAQANIKYYYRLRQVDTKGNYKNTYIVFAKLTKSQVAGFSEFMPNPTQSYTAIEITAIHDFTLRILLTGLDGRLISEQSYNLETGINRIDIDLSNQEAGTYLCQLLTDNEMVIKKIIKAR